jgi:hypothetical protein
VKGKVPLVIVNANPRRIEQSSSVSSLGFELVLPHPLVIRYASTGTGNTDY